MSCGVTLGLWFCAPTPAHLAFGVWEEEGPLGGTASPQGAPRKSRSRGQKLLRQWGASGLRRARGPQRRWGRDPGQLWVSTSLSWASVSSQDIKHCDHTRTPEAEGRSRW